MTGEKDLLTWIILENGYKQINKLEFIRTQKC